MSRLKVIALDPGVTTGFAKGVIDDEGYMRVKCGEQKFSHAELYDFLTLNFPDIIVCESFEFRKLQQGVNFYPVEMIGVINLFVSRVVRSVDLVVQPPSVQGPKAYWTDAKLKEANVYKAGVEHGRSAMKHLLYWYQFGQGFKHNKKGFGPWNNTI